MSEQKEHVLYTRKEWSGIMRMEFDGTESCFIKIINYLKTKHIKYFADIGANVGEVSKILLEELTTLKKVYAYEPVSSNFFFLSNRFRDEPKLKAIQKGIFYGLKSTIIKCIGGCGSHTIVGGVVL